MARRARPAPPRPTVRRSARRRSRARARSCFGGINPSRCRSRSSPAGAPPARGTAPPMTVGRKPPSGSTRRRAHALTDPIDDKVEGCDRRRRRRAQSGLHPRECQAGHAAILAKGPGEAAVDRPGPRRRLGRPYRLQRHARQDERRHQARRVRGQLHPLRRARARHGRGDERARPAWRHRALWRHLPRLLRLLPPRDPPLGADAAARDLCHDA